MGNSSHPKTSGTKAAPDLYSEIVSAHLRRFYGSVKGTVEASDGILFFKSRPLAVTGINNLLIPTKEQYRSANFVLAPALFQKDLDAIAFVLYDRLFVPTPRIFLIDSKPIREEIISCKKAKRITISLFQLGQWIDQGHELDIFSFIPITLDSNKVIFTEHTDYNGEQFQNYLCDYLLRIAGSERPTIELQNKGTCGYDVLYEGKGIEVKGVSSLYRFKSNKGRISRFTFDKSHFRNDLSAVAFIIYDKNLLRSPKTFFVEPSPVSKFLDQYENARYVQISLYQVQQWLASGYKIDPIAFASTVG
jgi:hypothetical protein